MGSYINKGILFYYNNVHDNWNASQSGVICTVMLQQQLKLLCYTEVQRLSMLLAREGSLNLAYNKY